MPRWLLTRSNCTTVALFFLLGAGCCFAGLLRAIDYPLSLVSSPFAALVMGTWGLTWKQGQSFALGLRTGAAVLAASTVALVLPPATASLMTSTPCEPSYGLLFILLGPFSSGLAGLVLGLALGRLISRRWLGVVATVGVILLTVAVAFAEFLFTPGIRFYGTFYGLYHGAIYDEAVFVEAPYLWLRLWNLAVGALGIAFMGPIGRRRGFTTKTPRHQDAPRTALFVVIGFLAAATATLTLLAPTLGFLSSRVPLEDALSQQIDTPRFEVHCPPSGSAADIAPYVAEDLEFRADQIIAMFHLPEPNRKIAVYLYESPGQKAQLMGAGRTSIAKPWLHELHIHTHDAGATIIAHELAHVMLGELSSSVFRVPVHYLVLPRPGVIEGAAESVERGGGVLTIHQWALAMRRIDRQPDMPAILEGFSFWGKSSTLAYTACGSFVRYLIDSHGPEPFARLYGGDSFAEAYAQPLNDLLAEWNRFLDDITVADEDLELAEFVFSRPPVFDKVCPYAGARCLARAAAAARDGRIDDVAPLARRTMATTAEDVRLGQRLARVLYAIGQHEQGLEFTTATVESGYDTLGPVARAGLALLLADGLWLIGENNSAADGYADLAAGAPGRWWETSLLIRLGLVGKALPEPVKRLLLGAYTRADRDSLVDAALADAARLSPLGQAALGLAITGHPDTFDDAAALLEKAWPALLKPQPAIAFAAGTALAEIRAWQQRPEDAVAILEALQNLDLSPARQELLSDLGDRVDWLGRVKTTSR